MKKLVLLSFVAIAGASAYAQDPAMGSATTTPTLKTPMAVAPRFGIKAGANLATLEPDNYRGGNAYSANSKTSFQAGLFANIPLGGMLRFQPELVYSRQGAKVKETAVTAAPGGTVTRASSFEQDLSYLNLPLIFQYQSTGGFVVELGPQVGYVISAKKNLDNTSTKENNEDYFDSFDFAAAGGLGYMSRVGLGVNARYNFGLANIIQEGNSKDGPELKNRVFQISLSYQFGANK